MNYIYHVVRYILDIPHFVYPFTGGWKFELFFFLAIKNKATMTLV